MSRANAHRDHGARFTRSRRQHLRVHVWRLSPTKVFPLEPAGRDGEGRAAPPPILAILNLTPDSFSDGGRLPTPDDALKAAEQALAEGAAGLDIGGESTRPGAHSVSEAEQIRRVVPSIALIRQRLGDTFAITIDTTRSSVARAAFDAGADALNDVSALRDDQDMGPLLARSQRGIILMHRLVKPIEDHYSTAYVDVPLYGPLRDSSDRPCGSSAGVPAAAGPGMSRPPVVAHVREFLRERAAFAMSLGIPREAIVIDPGLGFGKSVTQNLDLIRHTPALAELGFPVLSALSRKSFVGAAEAAYRRRVARGQALPDSPLDLRDEELAAVVASAAGTGTATTHGADSASPLPPPIERVAMSVRLSVEHARLGAAILRAHDVREHVVAWKS